jgi:antitoxin HicB
MTTVARSRSQAASVADVPRTVEAYAALPYRLEITQGEHGAFAVRYPDLPGCITQVERLDDAIPAAREILTGWLEIALEDGQAIPLPRQRDDYSGKFMVRIPKSLHRALSTAADAEGVSLNAYVTTLLAVGETRQESGRERTAVAETIVAAIEQRFPQSAPVQKTDHVHGPPERRAIR